MASNGHFQLFHPPASKIKTTIDPEPLRRAMSKPAAQCESFPLQTLIKSQDAEAVVVQIIQEPREIQPLPQARIAHTEDLSHEVDRVQLVDSDANAVATGSVGSSLPPPPPAPVSSCSVLPTRVECQSTPSQSRANSPIVPMRSMFPTYNPNLPLSQQQYYPQRQASLRGQVASRADYSPYLASPSQLDEVLGGAKTAPSSVLDFPTDDIADQKTLFSSKQELERLWEAANGQEPDAASENFDLRMSRIEPATFTFGSDPLLQHCLPFYTLQTYSTNELSIHRTNPRKPTVKIPILMLSLEPEARRLPPNDGLVTYIFPKLAAMLAIDQSNELAAKHGLAPTHRDEMEAEAVKRAAAQESCRLRWNEARRRYELAHPAIRRDPNKSLRFVESPTSPLGAEMPVLHITISSHALSSPRSSSTTPPVILVTDPRCSSTNLSTPCDRRVSNLPTRESDEPLASLDSGTMNLHISAKSILRLMPSLYAIDSLISAIFAVAVADEATNPILAQMNICTPKLPAVAPGSIFGGGSVGGKSYGGSVLYATLAERAEAEDEARLMRQMQAQDIKDRLKSPKKKGFWSGKQKSEKSGPKQILVGEFDLEKLSHYQNGDRQGQKLPAVTRTAIKGMVLALQFVVWGLTTLVRILTWVLVGVTRAVTSEKF